ncbi:MAG: hypothetical protein K2I42_02500, partial [Anaeroplasmataceae bacterium]|nr:hypothetical protein [Anaeroplasmataceae bacterium]
MKKILSIYLCLLCLFVFVSCSEEKSLIQFEIQDNIQIEIDEYHKYYMFGEQVVVTMEGQPVPVSQITTRLKDGDQLSLGKHTIEIVCTINNKEYVKSVEVTFIDSYSEIEVYLLGKSYTFRMKNHEELDLSLLQIEEKYQLDGLFFDDQFK